VLLGHAAHFILFAGDLLAIGADEDPAVMEKSLRETAPAVPLKCATDAGTAARYVSARLKTTWPGDDVLARRAAEDPGEDPDRHRDLERRGVEAIPGLHRRPPELVGRDLRRGVDERVLPDDAALNLAAPRVLKDAPVDRGRIDVRVRDDPWGDRRRPDEDQSSVRRSSTQSSIAWFSCRWSGTRSECSGPRECCSARSPPLSFTSRPRSSNIFELKKQGVAACDAPYQTDFFQLPIPLIKEHQISEPDFNELLAIAAPFLPHATSFRKCQAHLLIFNLWELGTSRGWGDLQGNRFSS
jgi:hypothetical protein